jgi:WD40 repeat protein
VRGRIRAAGVILAACAALIVPASASALNPVSFSRVGDLGTTRDGDGVALLPDGRALVVGGYGGPGGGDDLKSTEFFNPTAGTFSPGPDMSFPRYAPAVARLPDGRVLVAGGYTGSDYTTSAEVFNPSTGTFTPVGPLANGRELSAAAPLGDGRVIVVGGFDGTSLNSTEIFDPKTNTFSAGPVLPHRDYGPAVVAISGGRVLVAGGYNSATGNYLTAAYVLDAAGTALTLVGDLPVKLYAPAAASLPGGRAMIAGGYDGDLGDYVAKAYIFDPATNAFSSEGIGSLTYNTEEVGATELADGRVLVAGGFNSVDENLSTANVLSVPSNSFKAKLKGRKVIFSVSTEGTGEVTDVSTKFVTTAKKKKKPKLAKTTTRHGGPGKIKLKIKLTKRGAAQLADKGKLNIRVAYTPDQGLAKSKKLKLRG